MKFSYAWLQEYFDQPLPSVEELSRIITMHSFEIESVEEKGGDSILDIKVLPNRSHDCFSYWGMAREIGALLDMSVSIPTGAPNTSDTISTSQKISLIVENSKLVPRAMKRYVEGVTIGESPAWLKDKLAAHGQRSINNVVDITNLVMFETGQPVHVFDYDKLTANSSQPTAISIRQAKEGETITTLDGKEFTLDENMLVISDNDKALDIAGVKGGAGSGVSNDTTRVLLSACNFDAVNIRKTSKKLGLRTDASVRFENAISPELAGVAMERLSQLVAELAGGTVAADVVDEYPGKKNLYKVGVSLSEINERLGTQLSDDDVDQTFARLRLSYEKVKPLERVLEIAPTLVDVPYKYGASILGDAPHGFDCSSFVGYVFAQAGIAVPRMAVDQYVFGTLVDEQDLQPGDIVFSDRGGDGTTEPIENLGINQVRQTRVSHEYMKGTPVDASVDHNGIYLGDGKIIHASGKWHMGKVVVEDMNNTPAFEKVVGYRRLILSNEERFVVTVPAERLDLRIKEDLIEEIGRLIGLENIPSTPLPTIEQSVAVNKNEYYKARVREALVGAGAYEVYTYAFQAQGNVEMANPIAEDKKYLRASLVDGLTAARYMNIKNKPLLGGELIRIFEIGTVFENGSEHQEIGIAVEKQKQLDELCGVVDEALGTKLSWNKADTSATANLSAAIEKLAEPASYGELPRLPHKTFAPISTYPFALRDVAVWTTDNGQETDSKETLETIIQSRGGELLARMDLFDTFEKEGRTSYAYHLVFQSQTKTLSDDEITAIMKNIEDDIKTKGWEPR